MWQSAIWKQVSRRGNWEESDSSASSNLSKAPDVVAPDELNPPAVVSDQTGVGRELRGRLESVFRFLEFSQIEAAEAFVDQRGGSLFIVLCKLEGAMREIGGQTMSCLLRKTAGQAEAGLPSFLSPPVGEQVSLHRYHQIGQALGTMLLGNGSLTGGRFLFFQACSGFSPLPLLEAGEQVTAGFVQNPVTAAGLHELTGLLVDVLQDRLENMTRPKLTNDTAVGRAFRIQILTHIAIELSGSPVPQIKTGRGKVGVEKSCDPGCFLRVRVSVAHENRRDQKPGSLVLLVRFLLKRSARGEQATPFVPWVCSRVGHFQERGAG